MSKITYTNKVDLYEDTSIADIHKVKASDMNEIKTVVNNNDDTTTNNTNAIGTLSDLSTTNKDNLVTPKCKLEFTLLIFIFSTIEIYLCACILEKPTTVSQ